MKKILKLTFKCVCVMLPMIIICLYFRTRMLTFVDGELPYYIWNKEKANSICDKTYDAIILGDSTANAAYVPEVLSDGTLNLALGGLSVMENYYILENWLTYHKPPKVCYLSFLDMHFSVADWFWTRSIYSHMFRLDQDAEMVGNAIKYGETALLPQGFVFDFISYELYLPNKYITAFANASLNQRYQGNVEALRLNELHGGRYMARGTAEYQSKETIVCDEFTVTPMFDAYYRKMIALCLENGIRVRIVKLPLPDGRIYTDKYMQEYEAYYDKMKKDYPEITVDWITEPSAKEYFGDVNHLNSHGALQFSSDLKERYPEDFDDAALSLHQIAAINDSLSDENKVEQILKWVAGKDYTVLFYDGEGNLAEAYEEMKQKEAALNSLTLYRADALGITEEENIYFVSGINKAGGNLSVYEKKGNLRVKLEGKKAKKWEIEGKNALGVMVIDNYNHNIVCTKEFERVDEIFCLAA